MSKGGKGRQAANDRSNSKNPNNPASTASRENRANQLNPTTAAYKSSRSSSGPQGGGSGSGPAQLPSSTLPHRNGCELCENTGPHAGPHGYFQEGEFYPFDDGVPEDDDDE
jgi:hypothetical protein